MVGEGHIFLRPLNDQQAISTPRRYFAFHPDTTPTMKAFLNKCRQAPLLLATEAKLNVRLRALRDRKLMVLCAPPHKRRATACATPANWYGVNLNGGVKLALLAGNSENVNSCAALGWSHQQFASLKQ